MLSAVDVCPGNEGGMWTEMAKPLLANPEAETLGNLHVITAQQKRLVYPPSAGGKPMNIGQQAHVCRRTA